MKIAENRSGLQLLGYVRGSWYKVR
jgi:hypothetical protein